MGDETRIDYSSINDPHFPRSFFQPNNCLTLVSKIRMHKHPSGPGIHQWFSCQSIDSTNHCKVSSRIHGSSQIQGFEFFSKTGVLRCQSRLVFYTARVPRPSAQSRAVPFPDSLGSNSDADKDRGLEGFVGHRARTWPINPQPQHLPCL